MKKLLFTITFLVAGLLALSQPESFRYQTVVRDAGGNVLGNQSVSFSIGVLKGSASGTCVYAETHSVTTNPFGLVTLEIGGGSVVSGNFGNIDWGNDDYYLKVEVDETGGSNYQLMGTSQLLSVPYALYAASAPAQADNDWSVSGNNIFNSNTGNVGIGTTTPGAKLDVKGQMAGLSPNIRTFGDIHLGNGSQSGGGLYFGSGSYSWNTGDYIRQISQGRLDILVGGTLGTQLSTDNAFNGVKIINNEDAWLRIDADSDNSGGDDGTQNAYLQFTTDGGNDNYDGLIWLENLFGDCKLHFDLENQETMVMHDGNLGIGTSMPAAKLDVKGDIKAQGSIIESLDEAFLSVKRGTNHLGGINFFEQGTTQPQWIFPFFRGWQSDNLIVRDEGSNMDVMTFEYGTGKIGIGTSTPAEKLDVAGNIKAQKLTVGQINPTTSQNSLRINGNMKIVNSRLAVGVNNLFVTYPEALYVAGKSYLFDSADCYSKIKSETGKAFLELNSGGFSYPDIWTIENQNGTLRFNKTKYSTVEVMTLTSTGLIGIGTSTPAAKLEVDGNIKAQSLIVDQLGFESSGDAFFTIKRGNNHHGGIKFFEAGSTDPQWIFPYFRGWQSDNLIVRDEGHHIDVMTFGYGTGNVGIGTSNPVHKLDVNGNLGIYNGSDLVVELGAGLDYAEGFNVSDGNNAEPGTVLCIDPDNPGQLKVSDEAYDPRVAGIVAGANGLGSGVKLGVGSFDCNVALAGRVYCNVETSKAEIKPGDMLTTSDLPGYAMKATDRDKAAGTIIGKAMEGLEKGAKGQILVLVTLQ
jgi:hypothetical protein